MCIDPNKMTQIFGLFSEHEFVKLTLMNTVLRAFFFFPFCRGMGSKNDECLPNSFPFIVWANTFSTLCAPL